MNEPLFTFLYGPTGSGKTAFALEWAKKHRGNLLSADSRQVYQDFCLVVGKDIPPQSTWHDSPAAGKPGWQLPSGHWLWGLDLVPPTESFTLSHWYTWVEPIIAWHRQTQTPLLIVGGTWLWMEVLFNPPASLLVPPNEVWRKEAEHLSLAQLQEKVRHNYPASWSALNNSDQNNARRLTRIWEVQSAQPVELAPPLVTLAESQLLVRDSTIEEATANIWQRVLERWDAGAVSETKFLMERYPDWNTAAFSATGYASIRAYIEGALTQDAALENWKNSERQYAKRQITWIRLLQKRYQTTSV